MATNKLQWKIIANGDKLPCQSFLRKKNGEILKLPTDAGIKVGQDAYYLPVDDVIEVIRNYPIEESEDERIRKCIEDLIKEHTFSNIYGVTKEDCLSWLEKQGQTFTKKDIDDAYLKGVCDAKQELEKQVTPQTRTGDEWVNMIDDACDKRYSEEYARGEYCHEQSFKWGFQEGVEWLESKRGYLRVAKT